MCGIAGIISLNGNAPEEGLIFRMTDAIAHRGPDGHGYLMTNTGASDDSHISVIPHANRQLQFGHRRLSIVDLSDAAAQPMQDHTGRYWIVYNGEIYNHREIRKELEAMGHRFVTDHSDTEVILESYKAWGKDCVHKFRGMFVFALWDTLKDSIWLIRDRFGMKPFYYTQLDGKFYFASEVKALLCHPQMAFKMNLQSLYDYLSFTFVPPPNTLFENIFKLAAGHEMVIDNNGISPAVPYYNVFAAGNEIGNCTPETAAADFLNLFREAVRLRTESDVPYGAYLSGGVDSSGIVALLSELTGQQVHTFSVGYSNSIEGYQNELPYAEKVAALFKTKHVSKEISEEEIHELIAKLTWHMDEPISDSACIPLYMISKIARDNGVVVCLGGEGSDEAFAGYQMWRFMYQYQNMNDKFKWLQPVFGMAASHPVIYRKRSFYKNWSSRIAKGQQIFRGGVEYLNDEEKDAVFKSGFAAAHKLQPVYRIVEQYNERYKRESGGNDILNRMTYIDLNLRLPELMLSRIDKMSMAAGVEARAPFMDHKLIEYSMTIPAAIKFKNRTEKYVVKKGLENYLPDEILHRQKVGFSMPTYHYLRTNMNAYMKDLFVRFRKEYDFFDDDFIEFLLSTKDDSKTWYFLNLAAWWDRFK